MNEALKLAGINKEQLNSMIVEKLHKEGVHLSDFDADQQRQIIVMYGAVILRDLTK